MAKEPVSRIIWTDPAIADLDEIADYIALYKPSAAAKLIAKVFKRTDLLAYFPLSGRRVPELPELSYREVIVKPCRIIYRIEGGYTFIVLVQRGERRLQRSRIF
jgi:plasmid stabilization system protein ParE